VSADVVLAVHSDMATLPVVTWQQLFPVDASWLSWDFEGAIHTSRAIPRDVGPASEVLLGLPPRTTVQVSLHVTIDGQEHSWALGPVTTGNLPTDLPPSALAFADEALHRADPWLLTSVDVGPAAFFGPSYTVVLDIKGRVVWYRKTSGSRLTWQPQVSRNGGYVLIDESSDNPRNVGTVTKLTLDLSQQEVIELPSWGSAFDELEDGSILYDEAENFLEFHLALMDPNGESTRLWSCFPWMNDYVDDYWGCLPSSIRVDPVRDTILWSMATTSTVVELERDGTPLAEYGRYPGGYVFEPPVKTFERQHSPVFTAPDRLLVSTHSLDGNKQLAREYEVDEEENVLRMLTEIEADRFAERAGQIQPLPNGNLLWEHGTAGSIQEVTPDGTVVWEAGWTNHMIGHVTPIADLYALTTGW
jgi:hypothetical protein